jgi:PHP domain
MLKVAIHCHSTYSDGEFTLAQLRDMFVGQGYDAVCMTDHAEWFDQASVQAYADDCAALSDDKFRFVPGLEFECERRMHILGYGVTAPAGSTDPQEVIRHIETHGGVSVIAHPGDSMFEWIETFDVLPSGIETWNSKYDGPLAPRPRTFRLLHRLQNRNPAMKAFYGQDLHWKKQYRRLFNLLDCENEQSAILAALRTGKFHGVHEHTDQLPSSGVLPEDLLADFEVLNARYMRKQGVFKRMKKLSGAMGKNLPAPVKAHIRKWFS